MLKTRVTGAFIGLIVMAAACSKKVMPDGTTKEKAKSEKANTANTSAEKKPVPAGASTGKATEGKAGMMGADPVQSQTAQKDQKEQKEQSPGSGTPGTAPDELSGSSIYSTKCGKCHAPKNVRAYTFSQWQPILKKMIPNAKLSKDEEENLVSYIKANCN